MLALVVLYYLLYGSLFTIAKLAFAYTNPIFLIGFRTVIAGALLLVYQYFNDSNDFWRFKLRDWFFLLQVTFFHIVFVYVPEYWGLQFVSGAKASLIFSVAPFVTAFLAYFLLNERLKPIQWCGLIVGSIGLIPILLTQQIKEEALVHVGFLSVPEIMLLVSAASLAYGWILMKRGMVKYSYSSVMLNGFSMFWGGIISLFISCAVEGKPVLKMPVGAVGTSLLPYENAWVMFSVYLVLLTILVNICYTLYGGLLKRYSTTFLSFASFIAPVFTAFFDWLFMGVMVSRGFVISMFIVTLGLFLFYKGEEGENT